MQTKTLASARQDQSRDGQNAPKLNPAGSVGIAADAGAVVGERCASDRADDISVDEPLKLVGLPINLHTSHHEQSQSGRSEHAHRVVVVVAERIGQVTCRLASSLGS